MGMTVDFSDFEKGCKRIVEGAIPEEAAKGLFNAGNRLLLDAVEKAPQAPKDIGDLWGSKRVTEAKIERNRIIVDAGFNIVYAARWHEISITRAAQINWTIDKGAISPGPKYLEMKLMMYKNDYMEITANHIKNSAK